MFDPHRIRRSDRRYYTRKGQILQASRVDVQPIIDQRLVPVYQKYLQANNLLPVRQIPPEPVPVTGVLFGEYNYSFNQRNTEPTANITIRGDPSYGSYYAIIHQDPSNNYYFQVGTVPRNTTRTITIENNVLCLYRTQRFTSTDNPSDFANWDKSLLTGDIRDKMIIISTKAPELYISGEIPLKLD